MQATSNKMRIVIAAVIFAAVFCGFKMLFASMKTTAVIVPQVQAIAEKPLIRSIRIYGTEDDFGIELNGDQAFLLQEAREPERKKISFEVGEKVVNQFYLVKDLESFNSKKIQQHDTDTHLFINVYDEKPEKYSEEWVAYAIPLELLNSDTPIAVWVKSLDKMRSRQASE